MKRGCFRPETEFGIWVHFQDANAANCLVVAACFWLLAFFGGLGARSRRGFGSLSLEPVPELPLLEEAGLNFCRVGVGPHDFLANAFQAVNGIFWGFWKKHRHCAPHGTDPEWSSLRRFEAYLSEPFSSWAEAMDRIGASVSLFRSQKPPDYMAIKDFLDGSLTPATVERTAFGLPIRFFYRSLERKVLEGLLTEFLEKKLPLLQKGAAKKEARKVTLYGKKKRIQRLRELVPGLSEREIKAMLKKTRLQSTADVQGESHDRRASPLMFRVMKFQPAGFRALALFMPTPHLLDGREKIHVACGYSKSSVHVPEPTPAFQAVRDYLRDLNWERVL